MKILSYIILSGLIVLLYFFIVDFFLPHAGVNFNSLEVEVEAPLDKNKLVIEKGVFTINRDSDLELFLGKHSLGYEHKQMIFQGKKLNRLETDYGENDFLFCL